MNGKREDFVRILRGELQGAGQYYLDGKTSSYEREDDGCNFDSYCNRLESDLYECLLELEIDEISYEDFSWEMNEWVSADDSSYFDGDDERDHDEKNEIDLILDRDIE